MQRPAAPSEVLGTIDFAGRRIPFSTTSATTHALYVDFPGQDVPNDSEFKKAELTLGNQVLELGRGKFLAHPSHPHRRAIDREPQPGRGQLVFLDDVYDFSALFKQGSVVTLGQRVRQLNVVWSRKTDIKPAFRRYVGDLVYDLQVYRAIFDAIDRNLESSNEDVVAYTQHAAIVRAYPQFRAFLNKQLDMLREETKDFSKEENERHGFYFRKHLWDVIMSSAIMQRTNLKPRGYPGDSLMMRMIYDMQFIGASIFSKMMHYHPLEQPAAQAVRNRVDMIAERYLSLRKEHAPGATFRIMSVACGPMWELRSMLKASDDFDGLEIALLDQDRDALREAEETVRSLERRFDHKLPTLVVCESVRTMLRTARLSELWGKYNFVYSMGLFDYLTDPVARAVTTKLYELLAPGGVLMVGNFHPQNPNRQYMEYWLDWPLFYRNEEEILDLARTLPGAECSLSFEHTGCQVFLCVRKQR
jgi:extracellular factor (EF) 3-hydroxypalmitic acid methyl ester biosynthesis protein